MDIIIVVVLLAVGIILILTEIFLLPGITFAAVGGALFSIGGVIYAYTALGTTAGNITLVISLILFGIVFIWLIRSKALNKIALTTDIKSTVADNDLPDTIKEGEEGITVSRLNPIGKVRVNDRIMEAKSINGFIDENVEVVILKVYPTQLIVKIK